MVYPRRRQHDPFVVFKLTTHLAEVEERVDVGVERLKPLLCGEIWEIFDCLLRSVVEDPADHGSVHVMRVDTIKQHTKRQVFRELGGACQ